MNSTVHGTKDFAPLDHRIISAIKGTANRTLNLFSSLNIQLKHFRMCKEEGSLYFAKRNEKKCRVK